MKGRAYDDFSVLVPFDVALRRQREALADRGLDGRAGGGDEVTELVGGADDEGPERARRQLHQVDRDHAPSALHTELFEERRSNNTLVADESIRVQQRAANNRDDDDREPAPEDLRAVPHNGASSHSTQVRYDLRDSDGVGREVVLVLDHEGVDILRAVRHEVEPRHEQHEVDEEEPMFPDRDFAFGEECAGEVSAGCTNSRSLAESVRLGEAEAEDDDEDWRAGAEPVEGPPAMRGSAHQSASKGCS